MRRRLSPRMSLVQGKYRRHSNNDRFIGATILRPFIVRRKGLTPDACTPLTSIKVLPDFCAKDAGLHEQQFLCASVLAVHGEATQQ
jgi:hypothetical protein